MPEAPDLQGLAGCSRQDAVALFWQRCAAIAKQIAEVRALRAYINRRWGRAPRLPKW
jgi:hypothetical protein